MKRINDFFFPLEEGERLSLHDVIWFYGILIGAIALVTYVVIETW